MKNKESTRYFSDTQEKSVCKVLNAKQQSNSGAGNFSKGDCVQEDSSLLIECKTCTSDKESFSIKKEWLTKNKHEAFELGLNNHCLAFNFGQNQPNYYVIDENLMKLLVEYLSEQYR